MHILLIHQAFASLNEPGGTRHHEFARYLAGRGHRVTVITSPVSYLTGKKTAVENENEEADGVNILRCYTYPALHRSFIHRVFSFLSFMLSSFITGLRVPNVDVVWGTSPPIFQGGTAWALARLKRCAFLFEVRDLWPAFAVGVGVLRHRPLICMAEAFERFLYRNADRVVVNSPGFLEHVRQRGAKDPLLVPNGADPEMFSTTDAGTALRERAGLGDRFVLLYAGAHGMSNDLDVLLDAAGLLKNDDGIAIVLLGDGKEKPRLQARAAEMDLTNLTFLPPCPKTEMGPALAAADACLAILKPIPLYKTVYPNKVFDYMAAGKPVLLMIDGVIRTVVEEAGGGVYVPPGDAQALAQQVRLMAASPEDARAMGARGLRYIEENFSRSVLAAKLEQILLSIGY